MSFTIGSMYWINPKYSLDDFRRDLARVRDNRISLLRIFVLWEYVEAEKGRYDFGMYDRFFQAAEEYGIGVMPTLLFYLPFHWIVEQADSGEDDGKRRVPCLDRPRVREGLEAFVTATVRRYRNSPSLRMWNLWNEPTDSVCSCPHTMEKFAAWLHGKYGTVDALKESWAGEYYIFNPILPRSMDEVTGPWLGRVLALGTRGRNTGMRMDLDEFQTDNSAEHMAFLRDIVKRHDPEHETHSNPAVSCNSPVPAGISCWKLGNVLDSVSASVHPHNFFSRLEPDVRRYPAALLSVMDLVRSWASGKDAWIGEYQAGSTTFTKCSHYTPSARDIESTLYHALARGLRGVVFWEWQSWRQSIFEAGEFSLRNPSDGGETERSQAVRRIGEFLEEHRAILDDVKPPSAQVAVMHSLDQFVMDYELERNNYLPGWSAHHFDAAERCHQALAKAGIPCDFVTESQLDDGMLSRYRVLILANVQTISATTAAWLTEYVRRGGCIWADGRCGFVDKHIFLRSCVPVHGLDAVFGCHEADDVAPREGDALQCRDGRRILAFRDIQRLAACGLAQILAECNGYPAAVQNRFGAGVVQLWGTAISGNPAGDLSPMMEFAAQCGVTPTVRMLAGTDVLVSFAQCAQGMLAVFTSLAETRQCVRAELPAAGRLACEDHRAQMAGRVLQVAIGPSETVPIVIVKK